MVLCVRTIIRLDFHPDIAIITATLERSAKDLLSFLFVFVLVVLLYSLMGLLLYSTEGESFRNIGAAVTTMLFVSTGEFERGMNAVFGR